MPRPSKKDTLKLYRDELARSRRWRENDKHEDLWRRMVDRYKGKHLDKEANETDLEHRIVVNVAKATIDVIAPSIAVNNPKITVNARKPEDGDKALITEHVVNYFWRHGKFQSEIRAAVNDMLIIGHGWTKVGWHYKPKKKPEVTVETKEQLDTESVPAPDDESEEYKAAPESTHVVDEDRPFVERVSPEHVFVDPDAANPAQLRWICQRLRRTLSDVRNDKCYRTEARKEVGESTRSWWDKSADGADHKGSVPGGYVDVFEFYDLKAGKVCTFTEGGDGGFLIDPVDIPTPFANPFVMFRNYEVPDHFYTMGELEAIEVQQYELNETRSQLINHRRKNNPKYVYKRNAFEDEGIQALKDDTFNAMVPADVETNLADTIIPLPNVMAPPEWYNQSTMIKEDMDQISGVSDYMRGQMPEIRRTATEAAMLQDAQNARAADKLARLELTLSQVAEKVVQIMQQFLTGEHVFRVAGPNNVRGWVQYDRDYIAGEYDFEVEAGSTQPKNESFRRQSALQLMDAVAPLLGSGVIDIQQLAQHLLMGFGVQNPGRFIRAPQPQVPEEQPEVGPPMEPAMLGGGGAPAPPAPPMPPMP